MGGVDGDIMGTIGIHSARAMGERSYDRRAVTEKIVGQGAFVPLVLHPRLWGANGVPGPGLPRHVG